jgi:hypothetical protein
MNLFIPAVTVTSRGAQLSTDKLRKYVWSKMNSINAETLLVESGARLEENKLQLRSAKGG